MLEKKYQVFVSSTYLDLIEERSEVIQALLELDCIPVGMELFPAGDDDQWSSIKKIIDTCDYYILIIAGRYGSENKEGISYTQLEYEYAISKQIPTISFIHGNPKELSVNKVDTEKDKIEKLNLFREKAKLKMCRFWVGKDNLRSQISTSLVKLLKEKPRNGWVRVSEDFSEDFLKVGNFISFFTPRRNEFNSIFDTTIINSVKGDKIDIIGISQRLTFTDYPGIDVFIDKIKIGCEFRILLLHPDSILTATIENLSKFYGFPELRKNILSVINGVISEFHKKLEGIDQRDISGSIEIRLHKNLFSSLSYHSVNDRVLLGLYYSHISGTHCPTFELKDERTRLEAKKHFTNLWDKSSDYLLLKLSNKGIEHKLDFYYDEKYDYYYFEQGLTKNKSNYEPYQWLPNKFYGKAQRIIEITGLHSDAIVLDYGCAKGFLVKAFRDNSYECYGCDISKYAISNCEKSVETYCKLLGENEIIPKSLTNIKFDLILFIHVFEHLEIKEIEEILSNVKNCTKSIYIEVPLGDGTNYFKNRHDNDITHIHKKNIDWWTDLIIKNGFEIIFTKVVDNDYSELYCQSKLPPTRYWQ